ncbi:MAG: GTPase [Planctomycetota bacterium]
MRRGDTIAAFATPPGGAERAALRVSGPEAQRLVSEVFLSDSGLAVGTRGVYAGRFDDGRGTQPCLLLWMPGPRSYTREDVAEFHLVGAAPLAAAALARVLALGARAAQPGEFTRRAFEHGRIDLTRAEGVLELVGAAHEDERRAALALLEGGLERRLAGLRERLVELRALAEASLDFDESDTGHVATAELLALADGSGAALDEVLAWETRRAPATALPRIVLAGAPNAGKSSLFNALVGSDEALISEHAGTTRDALTAELEWGGRRLVLEDLPGFEAPNDALAAAAETRARSRLASADLVLWVVDAGAPRGESPPGRVLGVWNQVDRASEHVPDTWRRGAPEWLATSARTGAGLDGLRAAVASALASGADGSGSTGSPSEARELSARHRAALDTARRALAEARGLLAGAGPLDLAAELLRSATDALDDIGGRTTPEDLLDRIFARFCLGK